MRDTQSFLIVAILALVVCPAGAQEADADSLAAKAAAHAENGRHAEAARVYQQAIGLRRGQAARDDARLAADLYELAVSLTRLRRFREAIAPLTEAEEIRIRVLGEDHHLLIRTRTGLAFCQGQVGRYEEALDLRRQVLESYRRMYPGDHSLISGAQNKVAILLNSLGRHADTLPELREALAMRQRLSPDGHSETIEILHNLGVVHSALGRYDDAQAYYAQAGALATRLHGSNHPAVAACLNSRAVLYDRVGRPADALHLHEQALFIRRNRAEGDHRSVASSLMNLGGSLSDLGRHADADPLLADAREMYDRLFEGDHRLLAVSLGNLATNRTALGRREDALTLHEQALEMNRRMFKGDNPAVAFALCNVASALGESGRHEEALPIRRESLAMYRRLYGNDHPRVALVLRGLGRHLLRLGRRKEARQALLESADLGRRIGAPDLHHTLDGIARMDLEDGDAAAAARVLEEAIRQVEVRRLGALALGTEDAARYSASMRESRDPYPLMLEAQVSLGRPAEALRFLEQGRARTMLDLLARSEEDLRARAEQSGDKALRERLGAVGEDIVQAEVELVARSKAVEQARSRGRRKEARAALQAERTAREEYLRTLRRRLRLLRDLLPEASPLSPLEIQALLDPDERMLIYSLGRRSYVLLVRPTGGRVEAFELGDLTADAARRAVQECQKGLANPGGASGLDRLFARLVPPPVWKEIRKAKQLYLVPHGPLHALPFEALVVGPGPRYWLDEGPPVAYVASASVLAWLRSRPRGPEPATTLVAVADPHFGDPTGGWPDSGVLVRSVADDGRAHRAGLRAGDVIIGYGGRTVADRAGLALAMKSPGEAPVLRFNRDGEEQGVAVGPGPLGIRIATEPPAVAGPKLVAGGEIAHRVRRSARRRKALAPLPGSRREVSRIAAVVKAEEPDGSVTTLVGTAATERRLFDAVRSARFVHLATHGLIDETQRASFSALLLCSPRVPVPGDDGWLTLADLLSRWQGRLRGTDLVVLSACDTARGRMLGDEGVLALPWGFRFAGCRRVVASLWKVDDQSTPALMEAFYRALLDEPDGNVGTALGRAARSLRRTHPDPHHWAPFILLGDPR